MYHFGNSGKRSYSHSDCQVKTKCYMLNVVIFGAPGSGKGTQSELIIKEYAWIISQQVMFCALR